MSGIKLRSFAKDWAGLTKPERTAFLEVIRDVFHPACERFLADLSTPWPRSLRVKRVRGARGVWEMTWSFSEPDGRATFEWTTVDGELALRWRRIGRHEIFDRP